MRECVCVREHMDECVCMCFQPYLICLCLLMEHPSVNLSSQEVSGSCDGMDVTSQMEVELFHGNHLRISTTSCASYIMVTHRTTLVYIEFDTYAALHCVMLHNSFNTKCLDGK